MTATNPTWDSTTGTGLTRDAQNPNKILKQWLSRHKAWNIPKQWPLRTERGERSPATTPWQVTQAGGEPLNWTRSSGSKQTNTTRVQSSQTTKGLLGSKQYPLKESKPVCEESFENQRRLHGGTQCAHVTKNTHSCQEPDWLESRSAAATKSAQQS